MPRPKPAPGRAEALKAQGAALAAGRRRAGLSQPQAAIALGMSLPAYRKWEIGARRCPLEMRRRLAAEWGIEPAALALDAKLGECPHCGRPY